MTPNLTVKDVGEQGLLKMVQGFCPPEIIGDDAAILTPDPHQSLVVTTDMLVDGVHFSDRTTSAQDVGWRGVAANLSDLAAMGASGLGILVALGVTGDTPVAWVEQLYQGMMNCLQPYNIPIVGGDICRAPLRSLTITALGQVYPTRALKRSTAQPGYDIIVTGVHGDSRGGLELLLHPERGDRLCENEKLSLIQAHQRPQPRLDVIEVLEELFIDYPNVAIAAMDSSDGLADAILQICRASQVGARLIRQHMPISQALQNFVSLESALNWALYGGEDFELVLCIPPALTKTLLKQFNHAFTVGQITAETSVLLIDENNPQFQQSLSLEQGFQHF
ncbi:MAG: thiamine-phosphate kinase [Microcoleaceae cyanobacterium]